MVEMRKKIGHIQKKDHRICL